MQPRGDQSNHGDSSNHHSKDLPTWAHETNYILIGVYCVFMPILLFLLYQFIALRSHFIINKRIPKFSIFIAILNMVSFTLGSLGSIFVEINWLSRNQISILSYLAVGSAYLMTCVAFYRSYLVYRMYIRSKKKLKNSNENIHNINNNNNSNGKLLKCSFYSSYPYFIFYTLFTTISIIICYFYNKIEYGTVFWFILLMYGFIILHLSRKCVDVLSNTRESQVFRYSIFLFSIKIDKWSVFIYIVFHCL